MLPWFALAHAQSTPLDRAWEASDRGCWEDMLLHTREGLAAGGPDLAGLHRARAWALVRARRSWELASYATWHDADPDDAGLAVGFATSAVFLPSADCERAAAALAPRADRSPTDRYHALRAASDLRRKCPTQFPQDAEDAELAALAALGQPDARALLGVRTARADPGSADPATMVALSTEAPLRAQDFTQIVFDAKGGGLQPHRRAMRELGRAWAASDDPVRLGAAVQVLEAAGEAAEAEAARARLDAVAPCRRGPAREELGELAREIYDANQRPTPELALADLDALERKLPDTGADRVLWLELRVERLEALGRDAEVAAARRAIARAAPDDPEKVNEWAYDAALAGEDLAEALAAIDRVLPALADGRYDPSGYASPREWAAEQNALAANVLDTRGWLLHLLGRNEEATKDLEAALRLAPDEGVILAHAGLVYAATGDGDRALRALQAALTTVAGVDEEPLDAEARRVLDPLWAERGGWHPAGLDGWIAEHRERPPTSGPTAPPDDDPLPGGPLVGEPFPLKEAPALGGGRPISLVAGEEVLVVDVWATWCGPCVRGMPHLGEVAEAYAGRGVRVIGLSVDAKQVTAERFFRGATPSYELAWVGQPGWDALQVSGIPVLLVVAPGGEVAARITGYGPGDRRLERALDAVLAR